MNLLLATQAQYIEGDYMPAWFAIPAFILIMITLGLMKVHDAKREREAQKNLDDAIRRIDINHEKRNRR